MTSFGFFAMGELVIVLCMMWMIYHIDGGEDTSVRHLYFGSVVLTSLTLVFVLGMAMYYFAPAESTQAGRAKDIFDTLKQIIPPLLTLVLGFFFGKRFGPKTDQSRSILTARQLQTQSIAFQSGFSANHKGEASNANPYSDSPDKEQWEKGWNAANKEKRASN